MANNLDAAGLDLIFRQARTHNGWQAKPVDDATLTALYDLAKMGPTAANSHPLRVVFVKSAAGKELLRPAMAPGNLEKTMAAPVTAIMAWDTTWYENMPKLFPVVPTMRDNLAGLPTEARERNASQSAHLAAGYFIIAARALGLDCGPMAGFAADKVNAAFFGDGKWQTLLLINLGYGDPAKLYPRGPRLDFADACKIV
ncbi:MAG TPA: malonic semialdehyde reductase [Kofleriaceae bacterium]|nr:malonic semialdehyde reductase [Kofleriaceae bacterium]